MLTLSIIDLMCHFDIIMPFHYHLYDVNTLAISVSVSLSTPDLASVQATHLLDATIHISLIWEPLTTALFSSPLHSTLLSRFLYSAHHVTSPADFFFPFNLFCFSLWPLHLRLVSVSRNVGYNLALVLLMFWLVSFIDIIQCVFWSWLFWEYLLLKFM